MKKIDRPGLMALVGALDWHHPLGLTHHRAMRQGSRVQCYADFLREKIKNPMAIILVRIGDFYEAVGFDALVLCQVCGLNPMTPGSGVAEAGFPKGAASLRRNLNRLIEAGYMAAVVEEVGTLGGPDARLERKKRQLVAVVSEASPYYLFGLVEDEYTGDDTPLPKPLVAVSTPGSGGLRVMLYCTVQRQVQVHSQLSPEALTALLHARGVAQPLYLHTSVARREREEGRGTPLSRSLAAQLGVVVKEYGADTEGRLQGDLEGFKRLVAAAVGLDRKEEAALQVVYPTWGEGLGPGFVPPIPPSMSTIAQLGLAGVRGVPSLLAAALPDGTPAACRDWLRRLLLLPPPPTVAEDLRFLAQQLGRPDLPALPPLVTSLAAPRIAALVTDEAAGHRMLREVLAMLHRAVELLRLPDCLELQCALGGPLQWSMHQAGITSWSQVPPTLLADRCADAAAAISAVVPQLDGRGAGAAAELAALATADAEGGGVTDADAADGEGGSPAGAAGLQQQDAALPAYLAKHLAAGGQEPSDMLRQALAEAARLLRRKEAFRLAVRGECMPHEVAQVDAARDEMVGALVEMVCALDACCVRAEVRLAPHDDAVWARLLAPGKSKIVVRKMSAAEQRAVKDALLAQRGVALVHPTNRKRVVEGDRVSTERLEAATTAYVEATEAAEKRSRALLRQLCQSLQPHLVTLLAANELSVLFSAVVLHARAAQAAGWNWPDMPPVHTLADGAPAAPGPPPQAAAPACHPGLTVRLSLPGLWPYWMRREDAVHNHLLVEAGRMAMLTGPNMAGKSTVLRSVAAAALLSSCGLAVPAGRGAAAAPAAPLALSATWVAHVSLRNFSGDSPLEGKSAFAVEMEDTACTLAVCEQLGPRSLVLLDELGKGTEVVAGSALGAAVVDWLCNLGAAGVFATHLHDLPFLLQPQVRAGRLEFWAMEVEEEEQGAAGDAGGPLAALYRPTRRVVRGEVCLRSLALQVAAECGLQPGVLRAAAAYEGALRAGNTAMREALYGTGTPELSGDWGDAGSGSGGGSGATGAATTVPWPAGSGGAGVQVRVQEAAQLRAVTEAPTPARRVPEEEQQLPQPQQLPQQSQPQHDLQAGPSSRAREQAAVVELGSSVTAAGAGAGAVTDVPPAWLALAPVPSAAASPVLVLGGEQAPFAAPPAAAPADPLPAIPAIPSAFPAVSPDAADALLVEAAELLQRSSAAAIAAHTPPGAASAPGAVAGQVHFVNPDYVPSPSHRGEACVYVLLRWDGELYVGETEDVAQRLATHRASESRERKQQGKELARLPGTRRRTALRAVYVLVPRAAGGKSTALDLESDLIRELQRRGVALRSDHDKTRAKAHKPALPRRARRAAAGPGSEASGERSSDEESG